MLPFPGRILPLHQPHILTIQNQTKSYRISIKPILTRCYQIFMILYFTHFLKVIYQPLNQMVFPPIYHCQTGSANIHEEANLQFIMVSMKFLSPIIQQHSIQIPNPMMYCPLHLHQSISKKCLHQISLERPILQQTQIIHPHSHSILNTMTHQKLSFIVSPKFIILFRCYHHIQLNNLYHLLQH